MGCLLVFFTASLRWLALKLGSFSYRDLWMHLLGRLGETADCLTSLFLFMSCAIMLAGSGTVMQDVFSLPLPLGMLPCMFLSFLSCRGGGRGLMGINYALVPIKMLIITGVSLYLLHTTGPPAEPLELNPRGLVSPCWAINALLYVAYNLLFAAVILSTLPPCYGGPKGAAMGAGLMAILAHLLVEVLKSHPEVLSEPLPLLALVGKRAPYLYPVYALALWLAMTTTAAANLYGLVTRLQSLFPFSPEGWALLLLLFIYPLACLGFTSLIVWVYPLFGYIGIFLLILLLWELLDMVF